MELLDQAGIEIPFPQRDLRLRAVDAGAAATLWAKDGSIGALDDDKLDHAGKPKAGEQGRYNQG